MYPKQKIKDALVTAYEAIIIAVENEEGLDGAVAEKAMQKIVACFTPLPMIQHNPDPGCPFSEPHNFAECGLDSGVRWLDKFDVRY